MSQDRGNSRRKTVLITGASAGIGYELSQIFAERGHDLVLVSRDEERLRRLADELVRRFGSSVSVVPKDLSRVNAADEIHQELRRQGLEIDILVNNAGFNVYGSFATTDLEHELSLLQVCAVTPTRLMKLLLPHMLEQRFGRILNVGSTGSFVAGPLNAVYCGSKAYLLSLSEAVGCELRKSGVTITALCPGATASEFAKRAEMTGTLLFKGPKMNPRAVASSGYRALMRRRSVVVPGVANRLMMLAVKFSPRWLTVRMTAAMMR